MKGSSYEQFIATLKSAIEGELESLQNIVIKVVDQNDNKITINNKTFDIAESNMGSNRYEILPQYSTSGVNYIGYFDYVLVNTPNSINSQYLFYIETFGEEIDTISTVLVSIPLAHTIDDQSADDIFDSSTNEKIVSKIVIEFIPYFYEAAI